MQLTFPNLALLLWYDNADLIYMVLTIQRLLVRMEDRVLKTGTWKGKINKQKNRPSPEIFRLSVGSAKH